MQNRLKYMPLQKYDPHPSLDEFIVHTTPMGSLYYIHNLNRMYLKIQLYVYFYSKHRACLKTMPIRALYIQYIQLVDSYIYPKLPELYVTKTRGFVFNAARTI